MIGRGSQGQPWLLGEMARALGGQDNTPDAKQHLPSLNTQRQIVLEHFDDMLFHAGTKTGIRCFRKHLKSYIEVITQKIPDEFHDQTSRLGHTLITSNDPKHIHREIENFYNLAGERIAA